MKIRSKKLYQYLLESGVLNGTPEAIGMAKLAYRNAYKKAWKQQSRPRKEIRFIVTLKQFESIKIKASEYELRPATYSRSVILQAAEGSLVIPHRDQLLKVLQLVSMATIASERSVLNSLLSAQLAEVEYLLLTYLSA